MSYIDSSSLLKTLWEEPESEAVRMAIAGEAQVVVSALTELETEVQLRCRPSSFAKFQARCSRRPSGSTHQPERIAAHLTGCIWLPWANWACADC